MIRCFLVISVSKGFRDEGSKTSEMKRDRMPFKEKVDAKLSENIFRRIYRMSRCSFYRLHSILEDDLVKEFYPKGGGTRSPGTNSYLINTKTRLSIAIRFFAGLDPTDLMQIHNVGLTSVFYSVWVVIDVINNCDQLKYDFPSHEE